MESKEYLDLLTEIADSNDDLLRRNTTMEVKDAFAACLGKLARICFKIRF